MFKYKVGDSVKVLLGKDKGRQGKIERVFPGLNMVLIPGINIYKKHVKSQFTKDKKGGIFDIPRPILVSKIAVLCPKCKKITRVGFKVNKDDKMRFCKKCKELI